jgi:hypothetical protein
MKNHVTNMGEHRQVDEAIDTVCDKPVTTLAIVDRSYRVVRANGALSGARACAACRRAATQGVVPRIPR